MNLHFNKIRKYFLKQKKFWMVFIYFCSFMERKLCDENHTTLPKSKKNLQHSNFLWIIIRNQFKLQKLRLIFRKNIICPKPWCKSYKTSYLLLKLDKLSTQLLTVLLGGRQCVLQPIFFVTRQAVIGPNM